MPTVSESRFCRDCGAALTKPKTRGRWPVRCAPCKREHVRQRDRERYLAGQRRSGRHASLGMRSCAWCGATFEARRGGPTKFCGSLCSVAKQNEGASSPINWRRCRHCEAWYVFRGKAHCHPQPKRNPPRPCEHCGATIEAPHGHQRFCTNRCRGQYHHPRAIEITGRCATCGGKFTSPHRTTRYCSPACRPDPGAYWITPEERYAIYRRDAWRCQLCRKRVARQRTDPNAPTAPSLDHIVPRSCGGTDDAANLQLAHKACNERKSDAAAAQQLRLVG